MQKSALAPSDSQDPSAEIVGRGAGWKCLGVSAALSTDVRRRSLAMSAEIAGMRCSWVDERVDIIVAAVMAGQVRISCAACRGTGCGRALRRG